MLQGVSVDAMDEAGLDQPEAAERRTEERAPRWRLPATSDLAMLAALVAATSFLWGRAAGMAFWLDEGISVGVASHPLADIPSLLRQDGSPPLYYLILHLWSSVFGSSAVATHLLSLLFAVAAVPAALWAGWSLFGRRTGWTFALLVAVNPFFAFYANETRMYSLAALLALLSTATFLHGFVFGRRRYLPFFAVCQALVMYTHNWGLLLGLGLAAAVVPCFLLRPDRRRVVIDAALAFGAVALLYLPWVPSLVYQIGQDLQPWGRKADLVWIRDDITQLLGGDAAVVALVLGAGIGIVAVLQASTRTAPALSVVVMCVAAAVTVAVGWRTSVWAYRYLAVLAGPLLLLAAFGLARGGHLAVAAIVAVAFLAGPVAVKGPVYQKSNAQAVAEEVAPQLQPGDLVVVPDFQMVPLLAHYLPAGLRYATTSGPVPDEDIVDWRGSMERLRERDPGVTLPPLVDSLPVGGHLLLACPPRESDADSFGLTQGDDNERSEDGGRADTDTDDDTDADDDTAADSGPSTGGAASGDDAASPAAPEPKTTPAPSDVEFHPLILMRCQETTELISQNPTLALEGSFEAPEGVRNTSVDARVFRKVAAPGG